MKIIAMKHAREKDFKEKTRVFLNVKENHNNMCLPKTVFLDP